MQKQPSWKNNQKHYCTYCKFWIPDTPLSHKQHNESGRHKSALANHTKNQRKEKEIQEKQNLNLQQELMRIELAASNKYEEDLYGSYSGRQELPQNLPVPSVGGAYNHNVPKPAPPKPAQPAMPFMPPPMPNWNPQMMGMPIPPPPPPEFLAMAMNQGGMPSSTMPVVDPNAYYQQLLENQKQLNAKQVQQKVQTQPKQQHQKKNIDQKDGKKKRKKNKKKDKNAPGVDTPRKQMTKEEAYYNDPNFFFYQNDDEDEEEIENEANTDENEKSEESEKVEKVEEEQQEDEDSPPRKKYKKELSEMQHVMIRNADQRQDLNQVTGFGGWDDVETNILPSSAVLDPQQEEEIAQPALEHVVNDLTSVKREKNVNKLFKDEDEQLGVIGSYYERPNDSNSTATAPNEASGSQVKNEDVPAPRPMMGFSMQIKKKK